MDEITPGRPTEQTSEMAANETVANLENTAADGITDGGKDVITPYELTDLDKKASAAFGDVVVRKDLVNMVKNNALVPTYVLEFLLAKYATATDAASIKGGVETVRNLLAQRYVHREDASLVQAKIREHGSYAIIDKVQVRLNDKQDFYEASIQNLDIANAMIDEELANKYPRLFVTGIWCQCEVSYDYAMNPHNPWYISKLIPVQMSNDDTENFKALRSQFTTSEWIDLLIQTMGFDPGMFGDRMKMMLLVRLIPYVERNYNLMELGPKGTGKSHIYSEFSPHGMLVSGGEVTVPKLFINNATGRMGLVGLWDMVAFDEFAGRTKKAGKDLVDIMKNYMANRTFSRGTEQHTGEASLVFVGNTRHTVEYMLKHSDLFEELPPQYHDPAFLDRIHFYVPGWEFEQIRSELFTHGFGFVVDYFSEILHCFRDVNFDHAFEKYFTLSETLSTRDKDGVNKTFSGLMKLIFPDGSATVEEMRKLLECAMEGRKRVKDQLCRIDTTMTPVEFVYTDRETGEKHSVRTLEEREFPELYARRSNSEGNAAQTVSGEAATSAHEVYAEKQAPVYKDRIEKLAASAKACDISFADEQRGVTFTRLFGPYMAGATYVRLEDPYLLRDEEKIELCEFLDTIVRFKRSGEEVTVEIVTNNQKAKDLKGGRNESSGFGFRGGSFPKPSPTYVSSRPLLTPELMEWENDFIAQQYLQTGLRISFIQDTTLHDRKIETNTGWRIRMGRGLDIYYHFLPAPVANSQYPGVFKPLLVEQVCTAAFRFQQCRKVHECSFTYIKIDPDSVQPIQKDSKNAEN